MSPKKSYDDVMAEREKHPLGTPRPYTPDHQKVLLEIPAQSGVNRAPTMEPVWRIGLVLFATLLTGYGLHGVVVDDLYLPGKYSPGDHYHGKSAFCIFMMLASLAGWIITLAVGRYDLARERFSNAWLARLLLAISFAWMVAGTYLR